MHHRGIFKIVAILAVAVLVACPVQAQSKNGWSVTPGNVTTGFNLSTGNLLNNMNVPQVNVNIVSYNKGAKYTVDERNLAKTEGKAGNLDYYATVDTFTGLRVNGFAGLGADLSWQPMSLEEKMIAAEEKKSEGAQQIAGVAKRDGFEAATNDGKRIDNTVILREGTEKFGWNHISYDRADGVNHARELKQVYGLQTDDQVKNLIMHAIQTGEVEEQVRMRDGQEQKRYIITKEIDGRPMKVVVDQGQYEGSVITAYPTKYKRDSKTAPSGADIPQRYQTSEKPKLETFIGAQAGGDIFVGSEITGAVGGNYNMTPDAKLSGSLGGAVQVGANAKGKVYAGVKNMNSLVVGASGDAFAGIRASGAVSAGGDYKGTGARLTGTGTVGLGVGATGKAEVKLGWEGVKFDVAGQAYLGIGGGLGLSGDIKFGKVGEVAKKTYDKAADLTKKAVTKTREVASTVTTGVKTASTAVKAVAVKTAGAVVDKTREVKTKATAAAKALGSTIKGWFS